MTRRTWVIVGASSIIAEHFAHLAAQANHHLRLVGRDAEQLKLIAQDIKLRYGIESELCLIDLKDSKKSLSTVLKPAQGELDLLIAHSDFTLNTQLTDESISQLIQVNILSTALLINAYLQLNQEQFNLMYLSSVAACRGRAKNSLYGASKAAIEVYLEGLQQAATEQQNLCIARLGFIDTKQTYGVPGVFYAAPPEKCAKACWNALKKKKRMIYFPWFWRGIMGIIVGLPFGVYRKMKES